MTVSFYYLEVPAPQARPSTPEDELLQVAIALNEGNSADQLIDILFDTLGPLIPLDRVSLAVLEAGDILWSRHVRSKRPIVLEEGARAPIAGTSLEPIVHERKIRIIDDLAVYGDEHPASSTVPLLLQEGMRSSLTLPLIARGRPIGLLFLTSTQPHAYQQEHVGFMRGLAAAVAMALERSTMVEELQGANEDLRTLDQLKTNFLSNLSHELRTPLSQVLSYSYALEDAVAGPLTHDQQDYLRMVISGAKRLEELLSELFDFTALESGVFAIEHVPVSLGALAAEVAEEARPDLEAAGLMLRLELQPQDLCVEGDPPRLAQILRALIRNACKFTPPPGRVTVRSGGDPDHVWVEVADTGIGIASDQQPRIFQKFFQVQGGPGRPYGGVGLGLALAKALAEEHGGTLTLRSELGRGSVFRLTLPRT